MQARSSGGRHPGLTTDTEGASDAERTGKGPRLRVPPESGKTKVSEKETVARRENLAGEDEYRWPGPEEALEFLKGS